MDTTPGIRQQTPDHLFQEMHTQIQDRLHQLEQIHGFRILYACESGSRAWGFASRDSDYDVRFIYSWPRDRYLGVYSPPDTVDEEIDENNLDLSGWDLRKSLPLFHRSNGSLMEWLHSPIVYLESEPLMREWREMATTYFIPRNTAAHYLGLSRKINGVIMEKGEVTAKKYLYVLRAILAARFIVERGEPIPVPFARLRSEVSLAGEIKSEIESMVATKAEGAESDPIDPVPLLDAFIVSQQSEVGSALESLSSDAGPVGPLDDFFRNALAP